METSPGQKSEESLPFNDNYDIAKEDFKSMIEIHAGNMTITDEEIDQIESRTRGQGTTNTGMKREGPSLLLPTLARLQKQG